MKFDATEILTCYVNFHINSNLLSLFSTNDIISTQSVLKCLVKTEKTGNSYGISQKANISGEAESRIG